ncbi:MAG: hypothetical protein EAZ91_01125 [Cytophagales bacterium]|nr:MAG: hypothetical protein EAZ91_01125 [Cytophagales bacterium]
MVRCLLFLLFVFCGHWLAAQDASFQPVDKMRGLPTNTIYDLMQDRRGFIWLATDKGLFRYDGVNCRSFNPAGLNDKGVSNLMEDGRGRIWCQNFTGEYMYVAADTLRLCTSLKPMGMFYPAVIIRGNTLMAVGINGIRTLDIRTFTARELVTMSPQDIMPHVDTDGDRLILARSAPGQLITIDTDGHQTTIPLKDRSEGVFYGILVSGTTVSVRKVDAQQVTVTRADGQQHTIELAQKSLIQNLKVIGKRWLYLFTPAGFYQIDLLQKLPKRVTAQFANRNCTNLIRDREGNLWVSTINSGLCQIPSLDVRVIDPAVPFSRVWAGEGGLFYGTSTNEVGRLDHRLPARKPMYRGTTNAEVLSLFYNAPRQQLLFNSDQFYGLRQGKINFSQILSAKDVEPLGPDRVAVAATGMLSSLPLNNLGKVEKMAHEGQRVRAVATHGQTIYAATSKGLWLHRPNQPPVEIRFTNQPLAITDLTLTDEAEPTLYAASVNEGVFAIRGEHIVQHITTRNGLPDNSVYRIRAYKRQVWWLTETAVQCFDLRTGLVRTYDRTDGLPDVDLKDLAFVNDTVYVATQAGLVRFPTNLNALNRNAPKVIATSFLVNQQPYPMLKPPRFTHEQNNVEVHLSVLSFRSLGGVRVQYQLNAQPWTATEPGTRTLLFPSLSPDAYTLRIRAINEDNLPSRGVVVLRFQIDKPFWQQYWFLVFCLVGLLAILYWSYRLRLARLARESRLEAEKTALRQELQQSRLTAIKSQMNPHFIFNALNTIQSYIYLNDKQAASSYLVKFSELTRIILDMSSDETVSLTDEIKAIRLYLELEQMRFEDTLHHTLQVDSELDSDQIRIPSMLIQPYIENAIKHGLMHKKNDRKLVVDFRRHESFLQITIDDNGVGRQKSGEINEQRAKRHESFATQANQKRLELLNDTDQPHIGIVITDKHDPAGVASGTTVVLQIPVVFKTNTAHA